MGEAGRAEALAGGRFHESSLVPSAAGSPDSTPFVGFALATMP